MFLFEMVGVFFIVLGYYLLYIGIRCINCSYNFWRLILFVLFVLINFDCFLDKVLLVSFVEVIFIILIIMVFLLVLFVLVVLWLYKCKILDNNKKIIFYNLRSMCFL